MTAMDYKLTLELSRADAYHLKVSSRLGEAEANLVLPFSEVKERALLRALERRGYDGLNAYREGKEMPVIIVEMYTGRTAEQKAALAKKLTEGTIEILGVRPDQVRVIIHDLPKEDYAVGGKTIAELQGK